MALAAGRLNHWVTFQKPVTTQDATTGAMLITWVDVCSTWAEVAPLSVRDFIAAGTEQSQVSARLTIRHREDIDATMRAVFRGRAYRILGAMTDPVSGLEYLTLPVGQGVRVT